MAQGEICNGTINVTNLDSYIIVCRKSFKSLIICIEKFIKIYFRRKIILVNLAYSTISFYTLMRMYRENVLYIK